jgi:hypothetical protein
MRGSFLFVVRWEEVKSKKMDSEVPEPVFLMELYLDKKSKGISKKQKWTPISGSPFSYCDDFICSTLHPYQRKRNFAYQALLTFNF